MLDEDEEFLKLYCAAFGGLCTGLWDQSEIDYEKLAKRAYEIAEAAWKEYQNRVLEVEDEDEDEDENEI